MVAEDSGRGGEQVTAYDNLGNYIDDYLTETGTDLAAELVLVA